MFPAIDEAVNNDVLQEVLASYPCKDYAAYQRLFSVAMKRKSYSMAKVLSEIKLI